VVGEPRLAITSTPSLTKVGGQLGKAAWPQVKAEFMKALALKSQIRRVGWFN